LRHCGDRSGDEGAFGALPVMVIKTVISVWSFGDDHGFKLRLIFTLRELFHESDLGLRSQSLMLVFYAFEAFIVGVTYHLVFLLDDHLILAWFLNNILIADIEFSQGL
jgi:hypothetical protein